MRARGVAAILIGILLAAQVVRVAIVRNNVAARPHYAEGFWPDHPLVLRNLAMQEVGEAAATGSVPSRSTMDRLRLLAGEAPLYPDPFLVEAALAEKQGNTARTYALLHQALHREPRSPAARYLLADLDLTQGRTVDGLQEMARLSRILPGSAAQLTPALAQFARSTGAADQLRKIFAENPRLEAPVLTTLAADPSNADLILSVASTSPSNQSAARRWQQRLLTAMTDAGDYSRAYKLWKQFAGNPRGAGPGLFNPTFQPLNAPAPFNWTLLSNAAGVAEPDNGALRVLYYGRDNANLAGQYLLLPAGSYRLSMSMTGSVPIQGELLWTVKCLQSGKQLLKLELATDGDPHAVTGDFDVPGSACQAQALELLGSAGGDFAETADVRIGNLRLVRAAQ